MLSHLSCYLLSILGMVILLTVIDLILPDSKISKYVRSIASIFMITVICVPIINFLKGNSWTNDVFNIDNTKIDENFLYQSQLKEANILDKNLEKILADNGFENIEIIINILPNQPFMKIENIFVDLSDLVLKNNNEHINKYTAIKKIVVSYTGFEEEKIIIDG